MPKTSDPFERAVAKEQRLRDRAAELDSPGAFIGLAFRWFAVLGFGLAAVLAGHWLFFDEPRWLVILHTVVFALVVGYWCVTMTFVTQMKRRRPDWFGD